MHVTNCLHPQRIYNKYTHEYMYVPCGKCAACRNARSMRWVQRLSIERRCWKYCVFFTLTYSEDNVPFLHRFGDQLIDVTHKHQAPNEDCLVIDLRDDFFSSLSFDDLSRINRFISRNDGNLRYLSVYDCQKFFKRLRKNLLNDVKRSFKDATKSDAQVRYYLCGEFGSTTLRPHYHGLLFFNSEKEAAKIIEAIRKSWTLGIVHAKFIDGDNSSYVAKYVNCLAYLPPIYKHRSLRPFSLCSKSTPLGTLFTDDAKIREIFFSASPEFTIPDARKNAFCDVPLWRTYIGKLYPRLSAFGRLSHYDRVTLYRVFEKIENRLTVKVSCRSFLNVMLYYFKHKDFGWYLRCYDDYLSYLWSQSDYDVKKFEGCLQRWYYTSSRVVHQARVFGITVEYYVNVIERFYEACDKYSLLKFYDFQQKFVEDNPVCQLIGLDREYFENLCLLHPSDYTVEDILCLESYGIDINRFVFAPDEERLAYQSELHPDYISDTLKFNFDQSILEAKFVKNKRKNDYLESHPELKLKQF